MLIPDCFVIAPTMARDISNTATIITMAMIMRVSICMIKVALDLMSYITT